MNGLNFPSDSDGVILPHSRSNCPQSWFGSARFVHHRVVLRRSKVYYYFCKLLIACSWGGEGGHNFGQLSILFP